MKLSLESIRAGLAAQLTEVDRELAGLSERGAELKQTRRQLTQAINALGSNAAAAVVKPAPKKRQVAAALRQLLADNGGRIPLEDLEGLVAEKLATDHGCSAMGLALRMREALASDEYDCSDGCVQAIDAHSRRPPPPASRHAPPT